GTMWASWVRPLRDTHDPSIPANLSLMYQTGESRWGDPYGGGFLGMAHNPFQILGGARNMAGSNMTLNGGTLGRLEDRVILLRSFDTLSRSLDARGTMDGMDGFGRQALG